MIVKHFWKFKKKFVQSSVNFYEPILCDQLCTQTPIKVFLQYRITPHQNDKKYLFDFRIFYENVPKKEP